MRKWEHDNMDKLWMKMDKTVEFDRQKSSEFKSVLLFS